MAVGAMTSLRCSKNNSLLLHYVPLNLKFKLWVAQLEERQTVMVNYLNVTGSIPVLEILFCFVIDFL